MRFARLLSAAALVGALALATGCASEPPPVSDAVQQAYDAIPKTVTTAAKVAPLTAAMEKLKDPTQPWTLTVIGDSTGNAANEWVYLAVKELAAQNGRPAVIHNWSIDTNTYVDETKVAEGAGAPIMVWNGSASGKNPEYSLEHFAALAPEAPDLLIVSHGHNVGAAPDAISGVGRIKTKAATAWASVPAFGLTLQNPRVDDKRGHQDGIVEALRSTYTSDPSVLLLDVHTAFAQAPDLPSLVAGDGFHPNDNGEMLWSQVVLEALSKVG